MRIRQGNDFIFLWAIERNGLPENLSNAVNIKLHFKNFDCVGSVHTFQIVDGNIVRVEVAPKWASRLGAYRLILSYEFEDESFSDGDRKCVVDVLAFNIVPKTSEADDIAEMAKTTDIMIGLSGLSAYEVWLKDNPDKTKEDYYNWLQEPATDIAETVGLQEQARVEAEELRVLAEQDRQSSTQEAISDAENATENANTAAQNADNARLAIQDDLALKADHGYDSSPKTLKEVENDLDIKAGYIVTKTDFEIGGSNNIGNPVTDPTQFRSDYMDRNVIEGISVDGAYRLIVFRYNSDKVFTTYTPTQNSFLTNEDIGVADFIRISVAKKAGGNMSADDFVNSNFRVTYNESRIRQVDFDKKVDKSSIVHDAGFNKNLIVSQYGLSKELGELEIFDDFEIGAIGVTGRNEISTIRARSAKISASNINRILIAPDYKFQIHTWDLDDVYLGYGTMDSAAKIVPENTSSIRIMIGRIDNATMSSEDFASANVEFYLKKTKMDGIETVSSIGFSETDVMSQKAVTDALHTGVEIKDWESGGLEVTGNDAVSTIRLRTPKYYSTDKFVKLSVKEGWKHMIFRYDSDKAMLNYLPMRTTDFTLSDIGEAKYIRVIIGDVSNNDLEASDGIDISTIYKSESNFALKGFSETTMEELEDRVKEINYRQESGITPYLSSVSLFNSPDISDYPPSIQAQAIYDRFDALATAYPDYITKIVVGNEATSNLPIHKYIFKPDVVTSGETEKAKANFDLHKFLINGGIHGNEKRGSWAITHFFEIMCNEWENNETIEFYRHNIEFHVIPVSNPYGFNANIRQNGDGLDLNREFTKPYESRAIEAQCISDMVDENLDAYLLVDCHTVSHGDGRDRNTVWLGSDEGHLHALSNSVINRLSRKWQKQYDFITYRGMMGYVTDTIVGSVYYYGHKQGLVHSGLLEVTHQGGYTEAPQGAQNIMANMYLDTIVSYFNAFAVKMGVSYK